VSTEIQDRTEAVSDREIQFLRCAYQAISERGVHRASLREIAEMVGVSKGLIPYYFKTKDRLVLRTMEWILSINADRIRESITGARTPEQQVLAMIDVIFVGPEQNRRFYLTYLDLLDHAARVEGFARLPAAFRSIVNSLYAEVIQAGREDGAFRVQDVEEAATVVRAIIDGLFLQWLQEENWAQLHPHYRSTCKRAVLTYLKGGPTGN
jgi:TetR/AcrR family transcriptional regulator, fatty acid metabolism regulator protein